MFPEQSVRSEGHTGGERDDMSQAAFWSTGAWGRELRGKGSWQTVGCWCFQATVG